MTKTQERLLAVMEYWDSMRLRSELKAYILSDTDKNLEESFFDDIATDEEQEAGKLIK